MSLETFAMSRRLVACRRAVPEIIFITWVWWGCPGGGVLARQDYILDVTSDVLADWITFETTSEVLTDWIRFGG
jgi:hypothetical protein